MSTKVRVIAFGVLAGVLLSAMRAPLGIDLLRSSSVDGATRGAVRAAGLLAVAVAIWNARAFATRVPVAALLGWSLVGYAVHGLLVVAVAPLGSRVELAVALLAIAAVMHVIARRAADSGGDAEAPAPAPGVLELVGLALAGGGAAVAIESTARRLRLLGLGLEQDDTVFGATFLLGVLLGAIAFGPLIPAARRGTALLAGGLALAAASTAIGLARLVEYESAGALGGFVATVGSLFARNPSSVLKVDISHLGTWRVDAVLAASCLIVPALLAGTALTGARHVRRLAAVVAGAAVGVLVVPLALGSAGRAFDSLPPDGTPARLVGGAMSVAAAGAALAALSGARGAGRVVAWAAATVGLATPAVASLEDAWLLSPWDTAPVVVPRVTVDSADGLFTVEPVRGKPVATVDRRRLTPLPWEEAGDRERLSDALDLLGGVDRPRVLLVGPTTPGRAALFAERGARADRTAPWHAVLPVLERELFGGEDVPGRVLPFAEAGRRLAAGEYDLVLVPPVFGARLPTLPAQHDSAPGAAPRSHGWSVPERTLAVVWVDASAELAATDLGDAVLVSALPFDEPVLGIVVGGPPVGADVFPAAARGTGSTPLESLRWRAYQRQHAARARVFARLAEAAEGTPREELGAFLATHFGAQGESSPFLTEPEKVEVVPEALAHLRAAALAVDEVPPGSTLREACDAMAEVLDRRREPGLVLEYLLPIAEAHAPWQYLELAVVGAYIEFAMDEEVEPRLAALVERDPYNLALLLRCADWERDQGREEGEARYLRRILEVQPRRADVLPRLALLAARRGAPDADALLLRALEVDPDDARIRDLLDERAVERP